MRDRPVKARAQRTTARFASVAVCVSCQQGRPKRSAQQFAGARGELAGEHVRQAAIGLASQCLGNGGRRVAEHRAGIAEAEICVAVIVDVGQHGIASRAHDQRDG